MTGIELSFTVLLVNYLILFVLYVQKMRHLKASTAREQAITRAWMAEQKQYLDAFNRTHFHWKQTTDALESANQTIAGLLKELGR